MLFTPALFAPPWMAQPRPFASLLSLGTRAGLAGPGRQPELPERELLPAHTWGSACAQQPATVRAHQLLHSSVFGCSQEAFVCPLHAHSARKAGVLLPTRAASCALCGCDEERQEISTVIIWAALTCALAVQVARGKPGQQGGAHLTLPVATALLPGSQQSAKASSQPSCTGQR